MRPIIVLLAGVAMLRTVPALCAVTDVAAGGFTLQVTTHVGAAPDKVYAALITPSRWWASDHTFSGNAANLHLEATAGGCWCEQLPNGGSVLHFVVVYANPGKALRLRGAIGPFQGLGVDGAMTFALKPAGDGTDLVVTYALGGYNKGGFDELSKGADGVLTTQVARLKAVIETGSAESH